MIERGLHAFLMDQCQMNSNWFFNLFPEWQDVRTFDSISSYSKHRFFVLLLQSCCCVFLKFAMACYTVTFFPRHCAIQNCCIMSYKFNRAGVEGNIKSEKKIRNWIEKKKLKWLQAMIRKSNPLFYQVIGNPCPVSFISFHCSVLFGVLPTSPPVLHFSTPRK